MKYRMLIAGGLLAAFSFLAHATTDLYQGGGSGKLVKSFATWAECQTYGRTHYKKFTCKETVVVQTCTPQPAAETQTVSCPSGTTGSWTQTRTYASAPSPTCWIAGAWTPTTAPTGACVAVVEVPPQTVTAWVRMVMEGETFTPSGTQNVRYGDGLAWVTKSVSGPGTCSVSFFGSDPKYGVAKFCEVQITVPAVAQVPGAMPVVNKALIPSPAKPYTVPRVRTLSATELTMYPYQPVPTTVGAFREPCNTSHMSFDDPIVYPGQPGLSHLHTFQGNAGANAFSTADSLMNTGGSTCAGGTLNRTAYWMPTLIDIRTGQPIVPTSTNFYYKLGYYGVKAGTVRPPPRGLRMIAGNSKGTTPITDPHVGLECVSGGGHKPSIPSCAVGDELNLAILFPQCWDGVNLDSPDHKSHMAYATYPAGCPSTHPVPIPEIALNVHYKVSEANSGTFWKLSSDNYDGPGGYSQHADWFMAWDAATIKAFVDNCINGNLDCHDLLLGDGRTLY